MINMNANNFQLILDKESVELLREVCHQMLLFTRETDDVSVKPRIFAKNLLVATTNFLSEEEKK